MSGIIGGLSAVLMHPIISIRAPRIAGGIPFVTTWVSVTVRRGGLCRAIATTTLLDTPTFLASIAATVVAIAGFSLGSMLRKRLSVAAFRTVLLWMMLALGLRGVLVNLI